MAEIPFYALLGEFVAALDAELAERVAELGLGHLPAPTIHFVTLAPGDDGIRHSDAAPSPAPWPPPAAAPWLGAAEPDTDVRDLVAQSIADALAPTPVPPAEYVVVRDRFRGCEYLKRLDDDGGFVVADQVDDARRYWKPEAEVIAEMLGNGWRVARPE